jgi:hypothetical protein
VNEYPVQHRALQLRESKLESLLKGVAAVLVPVAAIVAAILGSRKKTRGGGNARPQRRGEEGAPPSAPARDRQPERDAFDDDSGGRGG